MTIREITKIEQREGTDGRTYYCVMLLSAATGRWIVQGEHLTQDAAEQDRQACMMDWAPLA